MRCARCGIWRGTSARAVVAAVVDAEGRRSVTRVPNDDAERWDWLTSLQGAHGADLEIVLPDSLAKTESIGRLALAHELPLWLAPDVLVGSLRDVARLRAHATAAMLARLPECRAWRFHLRRAVSLDNPRQLTLL